MGKRVFEDSMHRQEVDDQPSEDDLRRFADLSVADWPTPTQYLPKLREQISAILTGSGFPAPEQAVFHRGRFWCERMEGERPNRGAPVSPGWAYSRRYAEPLTAEREAADLYFCIVGVENALSEGAPDRVFAHAVILGSAVNRFNLRRLHLKAVARGQKVAGGAKNSAHRTNQMHEPMREKRLARMAQLVSDMNVDSAAAQCEIEGLGRWGAIKRQWNRHREKRDS